MSSILSAKTTFQTLNCAKPAMPSCSSQQFISTVIQHLSASVGIRKVRLRVNNERIYNG